jgi:hypothetical protein
MSCSPLCGSSQVGMLMMSLRELPRTSACTGVVLQTKVETKRWTLLV